MTFQVRAVLVLGLVLLGFFVWLVFLILSKEQKPVLVLGETEIQLQGAGKCPSISRANFSLLNSSEENLLCSENIQTKTCLILEVQFSVERFFLSVIDLQTLY